MAGVNRCFVENNLISYLSVARFSGADAGSFLHAQLSADIVSLGVAEATFACYCSPRGQVCGLLLVYRRTDDFLVVASSELLPVILGRLRMFVLRAQVGMERLNRREVIGLAGRQDLAGIESIPSPVDPERLYGLAPAGKNKAETAADWKYREIEQGVVWLDLSTSEKFIPQMLGFDSLGAVSFTKGCYPGQEVIARSRYLGTVKRKAKLLRVRSDVDIPNGAPLELNSDGECTSAILVDSAPGDNHSLFFLVTNADPESHVESIKYGEESFQCVDGRGA